MPTTAKSVKSDNTTNKITPLRERLFFVALRLRYMANSPQLRRATPHPNPPPQGRRRFSSARDLVQPAYPFRRTPSAAKHTVPLGETRFFRATTTARRAAGVSPLILSNGSLTRSCQSGGSRPPLAGA